jgi:hypothetical protein
MDLPGATGLSANAEAPDKVAVANSVPVVFMKSRLSINRSPFQS